MSERTIKTVSELPASVAALAVMSAEEIAKMLQKQRIKGRPHTTGRCPLAIWLKGVYGGNFVVGKEWIVRDALHTGEAERIKTPKNLANFIKLFDDGKYPALIGKVIKCRKKPPGPYKNPNRSGAHIKGAYLSFKRMVGR